MLLFASGAKPDIASLNLVTFWEGTREVAPAQIVTCWRVEEVGVIRRISLKSLRIGMARMGIVTNSIL